MSRSENLKENKKQPKDQNKSKTQGSSVMGNLKKLPTSEAVPLKLVKSPKFKRKKKTSKTQMASEMISESTDVTDVEEDQTDTMGFSPSYLKAVPPNHYISISVQLKQVMLLNIFKYITVNQNMVITKVDRCLMTEFMPGDQISGVNGKSVWNLEDMCERVSGTQHTSVVTVIRVWNMRCWTDDQLKTLVEKYTEPEVGKQYFVVRMYCKSGGRGGMKLGSTWKNVTVKNVRANTAVSTALLSGDEVYGVNNKFLYGINKRAMIKMAYELVEKSTDGFADIMASRRIGARSSPAPSLEADLGKKFPDSAVGVRRGNKVVRKDPEQLMGLPFPADALEIALRELTFLQQWVKPDWENLPCDKGESLLCELPRKSLMMPPISLTPCTSPRPSANTPRDSQALPPSAVLPVTEYSTSLPVKTISLRPKNFEKSIEQPPPPISSQKTKKMEEMTETDHLMSRVKITNVPEQSNITSDIPEEEELKKCNEKAGLMTYFKNKFGPGKTL
ncbi:unnamed protein product [Caenorhabditis nigoni]